MSLKPVVPRVLTYKVLDFVSSSKRYKRKFNSNCNLQGSVADGKLPAYQYKILHSHLDKASTSAHYPCLLYGSGAGVCLEVSCNCQLTAIIISWMECSACIHTVSYTATMPSMLSLSHELEAHGILFDDQNG
jgi:hypothetical protein